MEGGLSRQSSLKFRKAPPLPSLSSLNVVVPSFILSHHLPENIHIPRKYLCFVDWCPGLTRRAGHAGAICNPVPHPQPLKVMLAMLTLNPECSTEGKTPTCLPP